MTAMERFANSIVVPVVVLDKAEDAVPTANAMLAGGIDTMEITFRTACAPEAIKAVAENCPDVLVGAGTVVPANVYGGLKAMKNLSAPFVGMKFLPTGGVNSDNIREYIDAPFIHAVGGSWVCPKADIAAGNWGKITQLCLDARKAAKGE